MRAWFKKEYTIEVRGRRWWVTFTSTGYQIEGESDDARHALVDATRAAALWLEG